jgi:ABC-2 type transport system permease protein
MGKTFAIARRELGATFFSPVGYVVAALFLCVCMIKLVPPPWYVDEWFILVPGHEASLRPLFDLMALAMVFAVPLLTMRLMSEEFRSGTIETLMTAPVTDTQVILGKFLGVMAFYLMLLGGTLILLVLMMAYGEPDFGVAAMGYLGMVLLGAAFVAVGVFASTLTQHQLLAAVVGILILGIFGVVMPFLIPGAPVPLNYLAEKLSVMTYFKDFSKGIFDSRGLAFFLSAAGLFLFLSVKTLESRRWR